MSESSGLGVKSRIDRLVAKDEVGQRARGRESARRRIARWCDDRIAPAVDAVAVLHCVADVALRIDRAGEVMMQVATLRHSLEKMHQQRALRSDVVQIRGRAIGG